MKKLRVATHSLRPTNIVMTYLISPSMKITLMSMRISHSSFLTAIRVITNSKHEVLMCQMIFRTTILHQHTSKLNQTIISDKTMHHLFHMIISQVLKQTSSRSYRTPASKTRKSGRRLCTTFTPGTHPPKSHQPNKNANSGSPSS